MNWVDPFRWLEGLDLDLEVNPNGAQTQSFLSEKEKILGDTEKSIAAEKET